MGSKGGFDAGIIEVDDNLVLTVRIESHNHPSAIEPYGGAATGVGGVVRDILSVGTRPIALMNGLRFGDINGNNTKVNQHTRWLLRNVVSRYFRLRQLYRSSNHRRRARV